MDNAQIIYRYFPSLSEMQKKQMDQLGELYADWNSKINVISRKDIDNFYERHVLHSLGIAKIVSFKPKTKILDVGTGGGFPGIPLAILFPESEFYLIDSIGKKIKVVNAVAESLGLKNVRAEQIRLTASPLSSPLLEERGKRGEAKFHFVISRAVTELPEFQKWMKNKFLPESFNDLSNGILYLRGDGGEGNKIFELKNYFTEEFFETKQVVFIPAS
ncbi:MAG: 16S rRNA (guanine(527)-N(7))-methyltransferase RsmG [Bacteroidetes bacterium]|nr:16S rRNA (guanine(527)-N(7))-methyltransferase RsmG [Bacteroidota bacterium]